MDKLTDMKVKGKIAAFGSGEDTLLSRTVLGISRMTIHNGPGIRTLILFKGCPLRCAWCSTPESQKESPEIAVYPRKCNACQQCVNVCPQHAIQIKDKGILIDRKLCTACGKCAEACYTEAIQLLGKKMTVDELVNEVLKDEVIYKKSKGGVTLSGGEPLLYPDFNEKLLKAFKEKHLNVGIDTAGYVPWQNIEKVLPFVDFFLWDLKHLDPEKHKAFTGVSNDLILTNARLVSERMVPLYLRIPLIPRYNMTIENIDATCKFALSLKSVVEIDLLPFHDLGKSRYMSLDRPYALEGVSLISNDVLLDYKKRVESFGLLCNIV